MTQYFGIVANATPDFMDAKIPSYDRILNVLEHRAESAEQQLAEAKKDSARLDWLGRLAEVRVETDDGEGPTPPEWHVRGSLTGQSGISRESLRAAIDAAMQQEGQQ